MATAESTTPKDLYSGLIWDRLLRSENPALSRVLAEYFLELNFSENDRTKMNQLAAKARSGSLTQEEDTELDAYLQAGHMLAILQSKARQSLKSNEWHSE